MKHLVIAEHYQEKLIATTHVAVSAAIKAGATQIDVLVVGNHIADVAREAAGIADVSSVLVCSAEHYAHLLPEECAPAIVHTVKERDYHYVWCTATTFGKDVMPRVAALLNVVQISGITAIEDTNTFLRLAYAGSIVEKVQSWAQVNVITVAPTAFTPAPLKNASDESAVIEAFEPLTSMGISRFVGAKVNKSERPDLSSARIVVSGGRGVGSIENFKLIETLADVLGAAVGASRAAVDADYISNDHQVGQTGKSVAPDLYIAIGISGALQHLAGMKDAKTIVAINQDEEAPIMEVADYAIIGDLLTVVPQLSEALKKTHRS